MRSVLSFALAALAIPLGAQHGKADHVSLSYAAWKWERAIVPNAASPAAEQCAVLDADVFAGAAPGLRDVRLLQDGRELAYAIDESVDQYAGSGADSENDRSIYDTVATTDFMATEVRGSVFPKPSSSPDRTATVFLPPRVPVERLRLILGDTEHRADLLPRAMQVTVTALPQSPDHVLREPEIVALQAGPERLLLPVTLGANLQTAAGVTVHVDPGPATLTRFALEMRRREICYQPLDASPVTLLFGNANAPPAHYEFGRYFQPKATPILSTMGPIRANPAFHQPASPNAGWTLRTKLMLATFACAFTLILTLSSLRHTKR